MKVSMITTLAGPEGVARRGTVLDLPDAEAKEMVASGFARPYDRQRDAKAQQGLTKAKSE